MTKPEPVQLLDGRKVLVTGAARGLGFAFAEACCTAGAEVAMVDLRAELLEQSATRLRDAGHRATAIAADLGDPEAIRRCASAAVDALGGIDGLVNNAAVTDSGGKPFDAITIETWDRVMAINVRATWLMTCACRASLKASGRGAIVNLASDTALWGAPNLMAYVASKGAVIAMTHSLARELGDDRITVNALAPGLVRVEATQYVPEARHRHYVDQRAIRREQHPEDVCGAALFMLSDMARFVTGQVLAVNGGFVMN